MSNQSDQAVLSIIGERGRAVLALMAKDWAWFAPEMAERTGMSKTSVKRVYKRLRAHGLARLMPVFSDDDGLLHGSGNFLTKDGERLQAALAKQEQSS